MVLIFLILTLSFLIFLTLKRFDFSISKKAIILSSLQSLVISISLGYYFWVWQSKFPQKFPYPISGNVSFEFENKDSDIISIYFCIIIFLISLIFLKNLYEKFEESTNFGYISLIPFTLLLGQWIKEEDTKYLLFVSLIFVLVDILIKTILKNLIKKNKIKLEDFPTLYEKTILTFFFFLFSSFGIFLIFNRVGIFISLKIVILFILILIFLLILLKKKIDFFLISSQLGLPFILSVFVAPIIIFSNGSKGYFPYKNLNYFIIFILFIFCIYLVLKKFFIKEKECLSKIVAPSSILLVLILILSAPYNWQEVLKDDFHSGHIFLPWYLLKEFKMTPFLEVQPPYGLSNYLPGFLSYIFYDGTYSGITMIINHFIAIFLFILFFTLKKEIGLYIPIILLISGKQFFTLLYTAYFLSTAIFLFLLNSKLKKHYLFFLWLFSSLFLFLYDVPDGAPLILGTIPFGIFLFLEGLKNHKKNFIKLLGIFFLILIILFIFSDFEKIFLNQIEYLKENAKVNSLAQGIKWDFPQGKERVTLGPLWQFLRFFWLFILPVLFALILFKKREIISNKKILFLSIFLIISIIFLIPRASGRIDKMELSRPYMPNFLLFFVFPIVLIQFIKKENITYFILLFSIIIGAIGYPGIPLKHTKMTLENVKIYKPENTISEKEEGFCAIGEEVLMEKKQLERQKNLKMTIKNLIESGETFYNTTNHNADYFIQCLPSPVKNYTIYDISSRKLQIETIYELKEKNVPLVLILAENYIFDGGTLPFRASEIYFYLFENYIPFEGDGGYIWMIKKDKLNRLEGKYEVKDLKGQIELLNKAFFTKNLKYLPASWGSSISSISKNLTKEADFKDINLVDKNDLEKRRDYFIVKGEDPYLVFEIPSNLKAEYFYIQIEGIKEKNIIQVFWANDLYRIFYQENSQYFYSTKENKYLLPLSYSPTYNIKSERRFVRFDFNSDMASFIKVKDISIFKRKENS